MKRRHDTDQLLLTRAVRDRVFDQCDERGACILYRTDGRQIVVPTRARGKALVSIRRVAYALTHPQDHVSVQEEVTVTCEHQGDPHTGDGTCIAHLQKVAA